MVFHINLVFLFPSNFNMVSECGDETLETLAVVDEKDSRQDLLPPSLPGPPSKKSLTDTSGRLTLALLLHYFRTCCHHRLTLAPSLQCFRI